MAAKKNYTFDEIMGMDKPTFKKYLLETGKMADFAAIITKEYPHKVYPKVKKPMKKPTPAEVKKNPERAAAYEKAVAEGKLTSQADKTQKPKIVYKEPTFFEAKAIFAKEVLHIKAKEKAAATSWIDEFIEAAQNA